MEVGGGIIGSHMRHVNISVFGRVQGVAFRYYAHLEAQSLGIKGLARNEPDGSVYIEAEGKNFEVVQFVEWAKHGPRYASIEKVRIAEGDMRHYPDFQVE
jgi:acylphosphatase